MYTYTFHSSFIYRLTYYDTLLYGALGNNSGPQYIDVRVIYNIYIYIYVYIYIYIWAHPHTAHYEPWVFHEAAQDSGMTCWY